jgi:hypothetical protein
MSICLYMHSHVSLHASVFFLGLFAYFTSAAHKSIVRSGIDGLIKLADEVAGFYLRLWLKVLDFEAVYTGGT